MKCIKNAKTGVIDRVGDKEAENKVGSTWSYVSKSEWKQATRKVKANDVVESKSQSEDDTIAEKQLKRKKGVKNEKGK
jgi:hypothetical protein